MATSSKRNDEFFEACSGSEIKGLPCWHLGRFWPPQMRRRFLFRRLSIQLTLGGLLSSRARLCFTGRQELKPLMDWVKCWPLAGRLFHLRQRRADYLNPRRLFSLRQQV